RATSALLRRVLQLALLYQRVLLGDEDAVRVAAADDDGAAELELVGDAPVVHDRHALRSLHVGDAEAEPVRRVTLALDRRDDPAFERDVGVRVGRQLARREL